MTTTMRRGVGEDHSPPRRSCIRYRLWLKWGEFSQRTVQSGRRTSGRGDDGETGALPGSRASCRLLPGGEEVDLAALSAMCTQRAPRGGAGEKQPGCSSCRTRHSTRRSHTWPPCSSSSHRDEVPADEAAWSDQAPANIDRALGSTRLLLAPAACASADAIAPGPAPPPSSPRGGGWWVPELAKVKDPRTHPPEPR
jgi:hypothetical protein